MVDSKPAHSVFKVTKREVYVNPPFFKMRRTKKTCLVTQLSLSLIKFITGQYCTSIKRQ